MFIYCEEIFNFALLNKELPQEEPFNVFSYLSLLFVPYHIYQVNSQRNNCPCFITKQLLK